MDFGLNGKKALVLAASGGLGRAVAEALAAEGVAVAIVGRSAERLEPVIAALRAKGVDAHAIAVDLGATDAAANIFAAAKEKLGSIDILVNNTGGPKPGPAASVSVDDWQAEFSKMVLPIFEITRLAVAEMRARKWGRVLTIASSGVVQPIPNLPISNGLRASLVGWMKTLAAEIAADGVTVNILAPGRIDTDRVRQLDAANATKSGKSIEEIERASLATIPAARLGKPAEFGAVAAFLASVPASYVTGSVIRIDGGAIRSI